MLEHPNDSQSVIRFAHLYFLDLFIVGLLNFQLGREEPAMSMDNAGKIIFAKHSEILQANLKNIGGRSNFQEQCIIIRSYSCNEYSAK